MDLYITPSFCTGDITTAAYRYDLAIELKSSMYISYEAASPPDDLIGLLVEHAKRKRCRLVLGCNANAHHTQWGNSNTNTRGESTLNFTYIFFFYVKIF